MRSVRLLALSALVTLAACQTVTYKDGVDASRRNGIVDAEVERRIGELQYLHGNDLLQSMTRLMELGEVASPRIREGTKSPDWLTRSSLAWVMGASTDRRYIPDLRPLLTDPVPGVRYEAASALVELGDNAGFSTLVEGLADGDIRIRYKCFESLKRSTGQDFGYQHDAAPDDRRVSVARWLDWLGGLRASAL